MAELPYMFNKIAHFENQVNASKIDVLNDSLVFIAGGDEGYVPINIMVIH